MTTLAAALAEARARGIARLDAEVLLARVIAAPRTTVIAHDDRALSADEEARWAASLARRAGGEPLAYILGEKDFHGLLLEITADVLVPRPETELVVDWASELLATLARERGAHEQGTGNRAAGEGPGQERAQHRSEGSLSVVDLGTGSGAIALALKRLHPDAVVVATDVSAPALAVAQRNGARTGLALELVEGSWWHAVAGRRFDVAVANPPYVAADDPHLAALQREPLAALTPGGDGLGALRTIVAGAPTHLFAGGWLVVEHGFDQGPAVRSLMLRTGLAAIDTRTDLAGLERVTAGRLPGTV